MRFDINGKVLAHIYNASGVAMENTVNVSEFLNRASWESKAKTAYGLMVSKMDSNSIPIFVSTDQHGRNASVLEPSRIVNNMDAVGLLNINLGDTVTDYFNYSELNSMLSRSAGIKNYISVPGNHDAFIKVSDVPSNDEIKRYFISNHAGAVYPQGRDVDYYKVVDTDLNVKLLVICPYYIDSDGSRNGATIETGQMSWILNELQTDDYDTIILMHQLFTDSCIHRDGTMQNWADAPAVLKNLWKVCRARKNRASGTITDSDGTNHSYNFAGMQKKMLCSLHGHSHEELYQVDTMTQYVCNWLDSTHHATFVLIDRTNSKLRAWQFDDDSVMDELVIDI